MLVIGPIAVIAGLVWFFSSGTNLQWTAVLLILAVIQLVQGLARGNPAMTWVSASGVVCAAGGWSAMSRTIRTGAWPVS